MTTAVQRRRGTTTEHASFTGLEGEISVNTTKDTLVVHDGSTAGGFELARADGSNFVAASVDINGGTIDGTTIGASSASTGAFTTLTASGEITANGGIALGDNDKATFGAGDDLQIYHSGAHSFISDAGTGNLYLSAADSFIVRTEGVAVSATFTPTAGVDLNYAGAAKLATTATGIDVTGIALLTGVNQHALTIKSDLGTGTYEIGRNQSTGVLEFKGTETTYNGYLFKGPSSDLMTINASGQVGVGTSSPNEKAHLHGGSSATRLRISGGALSQTYGGFIEGEGVSGQGGYLRLGVVDNGINKVSMEIEPQGNQLSFSTASSERMRIDSSGNVGIGTSSPDSYKLNIYGAGNAGRQLKIEGSSNNGLARFSNTESQDYSIGINNTSFIVYDDTADAYRMVINSSGNVGIGTSSPSAKLQLNESSATDVTFTQSNTTASTSLTQSANGSYYLYNYGAYNLIFGTSAAERMRIDASGNVGIGTSSPTDALVVEGNIASPHRIKVSNANASGKAALNFTQGTTVKSWLEFDNASGIFDVWQYTNNDLRFGTNNTERMRIDSSGNLLVGTTTTDAATTSSVSGLGVNVSGDGPIGVASYQTNGLTLNRLSTDGDIAVFRKNGSTVGSIGVEGGDLVIGTGSTAGLQFNDATPTVRPWNMSANSRTDGVCDLGYSNARWKDLYLSGGVYLGGTGAANKLDDYEEGTFSGTIDGTTYSGEYTKIGNLVTISCYYDASSATNNRIAVVPFSATGAVSSANQGQTITRSTSATHPTSTYAAVYSTTNNVYAYNYAGATLPTPASGNGNFQFSYYTNS